MTRIYLAIITVAICFWACTKRPGNALPTVREVPAAIDSVRKVVKAHPVRPATSRPPVIVMFAKGSATLSPADSLRLSRVRGKAIRVTGYASSERGKRPGMVEAAHNYRLSLKRAQAVCKAVLVACTPVAGGETGAISTVLAGNRIAGFIP